MIMTINMREVAVRAWVGIWYVVYVVLRVVLRLLIGRHRRNWVQYVLGLHYSRDYSVRYGSIFSRYEPHVYRVVRNVLRRKDSKSFIDVGAFKGWYTIYAYKILRKKSGFTIIAVEPDPRNYKMLGKATRNITGIQLVDEAVFIRDGEYMEFHIGKSRAWLNGFADAGSLAPTEWHVRYGFLTGEVIQVKSVRLDTLIKRSGLEKVNLIKMDIEGAEYPVLTDPTLDLSKVENMVVEVHYRYGSKESCEIMRALASHGFKIVPLYPDQKSNNCYLLACRGEVPW
jgi:FkbM family methyltransferase